jgi:hypothetical protein
MVAENEGKWLPILVCIYLRICSVIRIQSFECVECSPHLLSIYLYIIGIFFCLGHFWCKLLISFNCSIVVVISHLNV